MKLEYNESVVHQSYLYQWDKKPQNNNDWYLIFEIAILVFACIQFFKSLGICDKT